MKVLFARILYLVVLVIAVVDGVLLARHFSEESVDVNVEAPVLMNEWTENTEILDELPTEEEEPILEEESDLEVLWPELPFTTQAPYGWFSPWTYYAEEAALVMALDSFSTPQEAANAMSSLAAWEQSNLGNTRDNSMSELLRAVREYYQREAFIMENPSVVSLFTELDQGGMLIVPIHGPTMENPNYGNPAPEHHVILIYGYTSEGFLAHDPGTVKGGAAIYEHEKILESIQDLDGEKRVLLIQPF